MAFDAFLKISSIPGESTDGKHAEWIEIESFNWGVHQMKSANSKTSALGGHAGGRADFADFAVVHRVDKASPKLMLACATGEHIAEVSLEFCKAGGDKQKYLEYKFNDVMISSVRPGGASRAEDAVPLEEVTFSFAKVNMVYTPLDSKTGAPKGSVPAGWDLAKNQKI